MAASLTRAGGAVANAAAAATRTRASSPNEIRRRIGIRPPCRRPWTNPGSWPEIFQPFDRSESRPQRHAVGAWLVRIAVVGPRLSNPRKCSQQEFVVGQVASPEHQLHAVIEPESEAGVEHADFSRSNL